MFPPILPLYAIFCCLFVLCAALPYNSTMVLLMTRTGLPQCSAYQEDNTPYYCGVARCTSGNDDVYAFLFPIVKVPDPGWIYGYGASLYGVSFSGEQNGIVATNLNNFPNYASMTILVQYSQSSDFKHIATHTMLYNTTMDVKIPRTGTMSYKYFITGANFQCDQL